MTQNLSLKDRLANMFQNNDYVQQPLQPVVDIPLLQMKEDGSFTSQPYTSDMAEKPVTIAQRLGNSILGIPKYNVLATDDSGKSIYQQIGRQGGILNDLAEGYNDNYTTGFAVNNLAYNPSKSWATRIGEGLGTVGRFLDSPVGRGVLAAGLNSALGYNNSLQEGLTAMVGRQQNKAANDLYRQQLASQGLDTSNVGGNITDKMYSNYALNNYRNRNLDQNSYIKLKNFYDKQLQNGILTPTEYQANINALNTQYVNTQAQTIGAGNVGVSNQTRNTDSQISTREQMIDLAKQRINLLQQRVAQGAATQNEISELRRLKIYQTQLENDLYEKELGIGGNATTNTSVRPVGQTKSGVKYRVVE